MRLHRDGRREEATFAYARAERAGDVDAGFNLGVLHYESGDHEAAEAAWRRCVAREHPQASTNLGFLLQRRGDEEGARRLYENAARWGDPVAAEMLARASAAPDAPSATRAQPAVGDVAPTDDDVAGGVDGAHDRPDP